jgi:Zn-dependent peptidase ImmA (M78 family)/transcriptional regulator with XRE-family HTH domain
MDTAKFNPEMLILARELRGMTQQDVAKAAGFSQSFVSQVEAGVKDVSEESAKRAAAALNVPVAFLYQEERCSGFGISMIYYRKRSGALTSHIRRLQAEVNLRRIHVRRLLRGVNFETPHTFQMLDIEDHGGQPEDVAVRLRATWMLPIGPVRNLVSAIESAGGVVFKFPFGTNDIDAMSQWPDDCPPLFFLNANAPADRVRFSLAHELGHVVMHKVATEDIESEADRFAAEFLMPKRDISGELLGLDLPKAAALKPHWRVSMAALIRRARDLNRITEDRYRDLFIRMGQLGMRKREPHPLQPEEPTIIPRIIDIYLREGRLDIRQIGELLCWPQDELRTRYLPPTGGLRLAQ